MIIVKFVYWSPEKGYGFIRLLDGRRVFVHASNVFPCRRGVDLMSHKVNEKTLKVVKAEKGWQAESVELIPSWESWTDSVESAVVWPGGARDACQEYRIITGRNNDWWKSESFPLAYDQVVAEAALAAGCPPDLLEGKKSRLEELRKEYFLFKAGNIPDRGVEISPEDWISQNGPFRFGIKLTSHGEKINFPDITSARRWMKEVRTREGEPSAEFICTDGPLKGDLPVNGISNTVYWYIWVFRPGCVEMTHGFLFPIPEGQVMEEKGRQEEFIYDSSKNYGANSFAEACDPDSMDYMF